MSIDDENCIVKEMRREKRTDRSPLWYLNWACLVLGLPLAFFAASHPPSEYRATLGLEALDCQGPFETYVLAAPALLFYGAGLISNGINWRRRVQLCAAALCLIVVGAVVWNVSNAASEQQRQHQECLLRDG